MISRRNIRIKIMQLIYAMETANEGDDKKTDPVKSLKQQFYNSQHLFIYLVHFLTEVMLYAEEDSRVRASRNLLTEEDLNVNTKIAENLLLRKILESASYKKAVADTVLSFEDTNKQVRKIYGELVESDIYKQYVRNDERDYRADKEITEFIFTSLMLPSESFTSHLEENFINWEDDAEMMHQMMSYYLKRPNAYNLQDLAGDEKWRYAKELLVTTLEKDEYLSSLINPKLNNWDPDRIALVDMILMKMGLCEILYFETIPPKVTINECIDIAKEYSTEQSGHFINGILDGIHKELLLQNKIHKVEFRQKAN